MSNHCRAPEPRADRLPSALAQDARYPPLPPALTPTPTLALTRRKAVQARYPPPLPPPPLPLYGRYLTDCLTSRTTSGGSSRLGTAADGRGIYGKYGPGDALPALDACGAINAPTPDSNGASAFNQPLSLDTSSVI